jgi:hypothetical protein
MTGPVTTTPLAVVPDADLETRWQAWQLRGADDDRRRAGIMGWVTLLIALLLGTWLLLQVTAT